MRVLIVADDLTGAGEVAAVFAAGGHSALVRIPDVESMAVRDEAPSGLAQTDVVVVDAEIRNVDEACARSRVRGLVSERDADGAVLVYQKIDSTLRGPIGPEIDALIEALRLEAAVVVPAFPAQGRTTIGGHQLVYGVPVQFTPAGEDPVAPAKQSHLPTVLENTTGRVTKALPLDVVDAGPETLLAALEEAFWSAGLCVVDAATDAHLESVAAALVRMGNRVLAVGTTGLARHLAPRLVPVPWIGRGAAQPNAPDRTTAPTVGGREGRLLIACGSRHPVTLAQVERLKTQVPLTCIRLDEDTESGVTQRVAEALRVMSVLLQGPGRPLSSETGDARRVARTMGRVARDAVARSKPSGLVLTGGDTAYHVLSALGATALQMLDEVEDGVPAGRVEGGLADSLPIITKAGGFGNVDALVHAVGYLGQPDGR